MKPSSKRTVGDIITVLSVLAIAIGVFQVIPYAHVDFPCFGGGGEIHSDTRIVYCISFWPVRAISGGGIYDIGSTNQNEIVVHEINLRREGQSLFVNNHSLNTGETYRTTHWIPSINPWVLYTRRFIISNDGLLTPARLATIAKYGRSSGMLPITDELPASAEGFILTDVLYVSGDVYEGWFINPLGFIILGYGIWLFRQGNKELKQKLRSTKERRLTKHVADWWASSPRFALIIFLLRVFPAPKQNPRRGHQIVKSSANCLS